MSDKNFTIYVTGGTNVFVPVLSDDPKQVSRVLDSLKRCYGDDDSEEVKVALSFVSDYLDDLTAEDDKKDSDENAKKETMNGVVMAVVPGKEPRLMAEDEFYKNHTDYDERVQILCASYLTVMLEYNHRKVLTLGEEKYLVGDAALYGYDSEKHDASEHGEMAQYQASYQANFACKEAVEQAINAHYGDNRLDTGSAVKEVVEKFGPERVEFILANTIRHKDGDGRISRDNKAWAKTIPMPEDSDSSRHCAYLVVDSVNPGLTDLFAREVRNSAQKMEKRSVLDQLKQEPPARKPAVPKKREPER